MRTVVTTNRPSVKAATSKPKWFPNQGEIVNYTPKLKSRGSTSKGLAMRIDVAGPDSRAGYVKFAFLSGGSVVKVKKSMAEKSIVNGRLTKFIDDVTISQSE